MTPVQTLGQSLDHWQALYIAAIAVAFASTAAIVTFAFHIQEHKHGLKISNYIYVVSSLLAVVSTIVIVNKTKSIDAEKDRQVKLSIEAADIKIASANAKAEEATAQARHTALEIESSTIERLKLQVRVADQQRELALIAENGRPRLITSSQRAAILTELREYIRTSGPNLDKKVPIHLYSTQYEAVLLESQLESLLVEAGFEPIKTIYVGGASGSGIMIAGDNNYPLTANAISRAFQSAGNYLFVMQGDSRLKASEFFILIGDKPVRQIP